MNNRKLELVEVFLLQYLPYWHLRQIVKSAKSRILEINMPEYQTIFLADSLIRTNLAGYC